MAEYLTEKNINDLKNYIEKHFYEFKSVKKINITRNEHIINVVFSLDQINLVMDVLSGRSFNDTINKLKTASLIDLSPDFPSGTINVMFKFRDFSTKEAVKVS